MPDGVSFIIFYYKQLIFIACVLFCLQVILKYRIV